jgi:hypothetical protein
MAINATSNGNTPRELIPTGNYIARCYKMIHIGTVEELILGEKKVLNKVRIGWELPTELKVFSQEKGEQPLVIDKEFTLSLHEKSSLRAVLKSWRGVDFTEEQAKSFDITKLLGVQCMINIIHKPSKKDPTKIYEEIAGITAMPKGMNAPSQINQTFVLDYDNFDEDKFNSLPDFIKTKMQTSMEYCALINPEHREFKDQNESSKAEKEDDLPF